MANICENRLEFIGDENIIRELLKLTKSDKSDFDFNKIIPMPESLHIEESSLTNEALNFFIMAIDPENPQIGDVRKFSREEFNAFLQAGIDRVEYLPDFAKQVLKFDKDEYEAYIKLGQTAAENYMNYGSISWYGWAMEHWGCKWNAENAYVSGNVASFTTPWGPPEKILTELSSLFPDITIKCTFDLEGWGVYGAEYQAGEAHETYGEDCEEDDDELEDESSISVNEMPIELLTEMVNDLETGDTAAELRAKIQLVIGCRYYAGEGVEQNTQKAIEWITKSAEQGNASAQYMLGVMYYKVEGIEKDEKKAIKWIGKAAEQGNASAQYILGVMYYNGEGVEEDEKKGIEWIRKAAEQGNEEAKNTLDEILSERAEDTNEETVTVHQAAPTADFNVEAVLKRGYLALEDGEWQKADSFFEAVLNQDAENARAYLGKLMVELEVSKQEDLQNCSQPFDENKNYQKVLRFGSDEFADEVKGYVNEVKGRIIYRDVEQILQSTKTEADYDVAAERIENLIGSYDSAVEKAKEMLYQDAVRMMQAANTSEDYRTAAKRFALLEDYSDAAEKAKECFAEAGKIEEAHQEMLYQDAMQLMQTANTSENYRTAAKQFELLKDYKDAAEKAKSCFAEATEKGKEEETARRDMLYQDAMRLMQTTNTPEGYHAAAKQFELLKDYKDAAEKAKACFTEAVKKEKEARQEMMYQDAMRLMQEASTPGSYRAAAMQFELLKDFKDAIEKGKECLAEAAKKEEAQQEILYRDAMRLMQEANTSKDYHTAAKQFELLKDYKDAAERVQECNSKAAAAKAAEETRQKKIASLNSEKVSLDTEFANLRGLFTGKRRREIEARLTEINTELAELK